MNQEALQKLRDSEVEYGKVFHAQLMRDIPYFHKLYAKYHNPVSLEIARDLGTHAKNIVDRAPTSENN